MGGTVLYTLELHFNPLPLLGGLGLFAVFVWVESIRVKAYSITGRIAKRQRVYIIPGRMAKNRKDRSWPSFTVYVLLLLLFLAATTVTLGFIIKTMEDYHTVQDSYENGRVLTAEGAVEDFSLRQDLWNYYEEFTVDGVDFSNWAKAYGQNLPGYPMKFNMFDRNNGGGLIREGQWLSIQYVTLPGRGHEGEDYHAIVFIEELSQK